MKKMIQFGAGNIGRSFMGQVFTRAGYEVVFIDIADAVVEALNREKGYRVIVKHGTRADEEILVNNVRAVHGLATNRVVEEVATADLICTAVGKQALQHVFPRLADGLRQRFCSADAAPIDIIFAENVRGVAQWAREVLSAQLPAGIDLDRLVGLVESSIGKMVPIMKAADVAKDPLWVFSEAYNTLILDARGFRAPPPLSPDIKRVDNIQAYVDRKLFIHNLGHAAAAYLGYRHHPDATTIAEVIAEPDCREPVQRAMRQAAQALHTTYPTDLPIHELQDHIEDLLARFANPALGDTVFRVGRDLPRKLHVEDRLLGAMLLADARSCPFDHITAATAAAFHFKATDEHDQPYPPDTAFLTTYHNEGLRTCLETHTGLKPGNDQHDRIHSSLAHALARN